MVIYKWPTLIRGTPDVVGGRKTSVLDGVFWNELRSIAKMAAVKSLTPEECHAKVAECRELAERARDPSHRLMLNHIAETWERICADLKKAAN